MIVGSDVKNIDKMLLIPAGAALTARQITILKAWGVGDIEVRASGTTHDLDPVARLSPETAAQLTAELKGIFWHGDESNPVHLEVFKLMLQRRARSASTR
jgi:hypothetical protein